MIVERLYMPYILLSMHSIIHLTNMTVSLVLYNIRSGSYDPSLDFLWDHSIISATNMMILNNALCVSIQIITKALQLRQFNMQYNLLTQKNIKVRNHTTLNTSTTFWCWLRLFQILQQPLMRRSLWSILLKIMIVNLAHSFS